ncbi:unnamed protein product [Symbiodinium sp. CCMP2456]|nr:unnamed protein product [Symbiodinium sp. CCMP2456]
MRQRFASFHRARAPSDLPDVVLVLGGTNDLSQVPVTATISNIQAMHELAASWGAIVGVLALPRFVNPKVGSARKLYAVNDALAELEQNYRFPSFFVNLTEVSSRHLYDGLHFTSDGYLIMAEMIAQKVWHWL